MTAEKELSRIEAFSDGVFAIAATLLILEIKVPEIEPGIGKAGAWCYVFELWPSFMAFLISFGTILVMWVNHHKAIRLLNKSSTAFLFSNGFLLLTVTFVPFPTAFLAKYINTEYRTIVVVFYSFSYLLCN